MPTAEGWRNLRFVQAKFLIIFFLEMTIIMTIDNIVETVKH